MVVGVENESGGKNTTYRARYARCAVIEQYELARGRPGRRRNNENVYNGATRHLGNTWISKVGVIMPNGARSRACLLLSVKDKRIAECVRALPERLAALKSIYEFTESQ